MNRLTRIGLIGAIITAVCCFTPILVWVLAGIGLGGAIAWLDPILLPLLGLFLALILIGYVKQGRGAK